jgi:hypothetical protein
LLFFSVFFPIIFLCGWHSSSSLYYQSLNVLHFPGPPTCRLIRVVDTATIQALCQENFYISTATEAYKFLKIWTLHVIFHLSLNSWNKVGLIMLTHFSHLVFYKKHRFCKSWWVSVLRHLCWYFLKSAINVSLSIFLVFIPSLVTFEWPVDYRWLMVLYKLWKLYTYWSSFSSFSYNRRENIEIREETISICIPIRWWCNKSHLITCTLWSMRYRALMEKLVI